MYIRLQMLILFVLTVHCGPVLMQRDYPVHLVVDAGSSGTRFCPFEIKDAPACDVYTTEVKCIKPDAPDGLADLSTEEIRNVIQTGLKSIEQGKKDRIIQISVLGTGGFRRHSANRQKQQIQAIAGILQKTNHAATVKVITGNQEAEYAWRSVGLKTGSGDYIIIETGGATVQMAGPGTGSGELRSISIAAGMNVTSESIKSLPAFADCEGEAPAGGYDEQKGKDRFSACYETIMNHSNEFKKLSTFINTIKNDGKVYALGAPWDAIFSMHGDDSLESEELRQLGEKACASDKDTLISMGVHPKFTDSNCYLLSYHYAQIKTVKAEEIYSSKGSWPAGAAVSGDVLGLCRL